jgi:hypothetical protein
LAAIGMGVVALVGETYAIPGFETEFLKRIRELVDSLPKGTAELYVGHHPSNPKSLPYFCITPTNPRAAKIRGFVCEGQGIDFTIGEATGGEVFVSRKNTARGTAHVEGFLQLCHAVITANFAEVITLDSRGHKIHSEITLHIDGRRIYLHSGWFLWRLFPNKTTKTFSYEPYY